MKIKEGIHGKSIFENCFSLKFKNKIIEKKFEEELRNSNTNAKIGFLCFFICVYILGMVVLEIIQTKHIDYANSLEALYGSFTGIFLGVDITLFFIQLKFNKR